MVMVGLRQLGVVGWGFKKGNSPTVDIAGSTRGLREEDALSYFQKR